MQFIQNGPEIPDALLHAHEEGRVVFFCGAGISRPAGLPGFKDLVEEIYKRTGTIFEPIEQDAFDRGQFDVTLNLLEQRLPGQRLPGQRLALRRALADALKPKLRRKGATDTHAALLRLARNREGALRLVTTNFDRLFHIAAKRTKQAVHHYSAPMLPIPKNSRWDGLVYLHGLLLESVDDTTLNSLIVTSGDFGLAYLTERWAARFVSELFRNFTVCFVGYSVNDPVLRYMMDALAADRILGETTPQAWAFGECEQGEEQSKTIEWESKGITPILYSPSPENPNHKSLHQTLQAWAVTYCDGVLGKERIVVTHALSRPSVSTRQDNFVGRMLWALSDKSGLPAKIFAEFNPVPPLDWLLEVFSDERYRHGDLSRFGVSPRAEVDEKLRFSLIQRPSPYSLSPPMQLVMNNSLGSQLDKVLSQLASWLVRHLNDPNLVIWAANRGGKLNENWACLIERELDRFARLELEGKTSKLEAISAYAPKAIPDPLMRTLWNLLLNGFVKTPLYENGLFSWRKRLKRDGLTVTLRAELRQLLSPKVKLRQPIRWGEDSQSADVSTEMRRLVDWELVLTADHVHSALPDRSDNEWRKSMPLLLDDFQQLLHISLDLLHELGGANSRGDRSHWDLPSISSHSQNRRFRDWVALIELLRDAWLEVRSSDNNRATRIAQRWFELPYPTFKRLALFAASEDDCITSEQWVDWLLADGAWCLWSEDTQREMFRLLVLQGRYLSQSSQKRLEDAILVGPPREMHRGDRASDHSIWLHFAKLESSGLILGRAAMERLEALSRMNPQWQLAPDESDEFLLWMGRGLTGTPEYTERRNVVIVPRKRYDLVQWLRNPSNVSYEDNEEAWRDVCCTRFFHSLYALCDLTRENEWPVERWRVALQAWSDKGLVSRSWRYAAPLLKTIPHFILRQIVDSMAWWLEAASQKIDQHETIMLELCQRVLHLLLDTESGMAHDDNLVNGLVDEAINHPVGYVTEALLNLCFKDEPNDNDQLPSEIKPIVSELCDVHREQFRYGRVLLSSRLIALFRIDRPWTEQFLLPLFNWTANPTEAKAVWEGFLWSPRLYHPLLIALKAHFLESANHYADLDEHSQQHLAAFLTFAALGATEGYTVEDFRSAFGALPQKGLEESAQALLQALEGAGDRREEYWKKTVRPFWKKIWPKSRDRRTAHLAELLARMCIAAGTEFSTALSEVCNWLLPIEYPDFIVDLLNKSDLCNQFPADVLRMLNAIVDDPSEAPTELGHCLKAITTGSPALEQDSRFQRLELYARMHDILP